ncbi:hypothetical protein JCM3775_006108 [Rhodotorula graminis]|uniref:DUF1753-domain-containing protein n=1 Tax=Rhodotorula graminis (strain WP1) TaxID=578459 RepID=A0A194S1K5_RHOGW|nr:uncharacterized protein RHOBADRAFT_54288 [Rhodotorula graminis WP1]KPV74472.1 hypothetical protein RHOBADRAFT_54288 [Rhodotorula graminis WP1]
MAIRLRAQPLLDSFLGMDLKLGATLISLFALLNKVAGAYGILAVLLSGGAALSQPLGQLTMYAYSIASLVGFIWGLQKISEENGPKTLLYAHGFAADHLVGTVYTTFFAVVWYLFVPHDGRRVANSDAQKAMMGGSQSGVEMDETERTQAAMGVWTSERGFSGAVLLIGWLLKIYFILVLYSFALHLRRGTYSSLPHSSHNTVPSSKFTSSTSGGGSGGGSPSSRNRRRFNPGGGSRHTRDSSTGGARYTHLRGASLASSAAGVGGRDSLDGDADTRATLADSLWEDEADTAEALLRGSAAAAAPGSAGAGAGEDLAAQQRRAAREDPPASPAFAKGTGMVRSVSGGVMVSGGGGGGGGSGSGSAAATTPRAVEEEGGASANPFSKILGRMSGEATR